MSLLSRSYNEQNAILLFGFLCLRVRVCVGVCGRVGLCVCWQFHFNKDKVWTFFVLEKCPFLLFAYLNIQNVTKTDSM